MPRVEALLHCDLTPRRSAQCAEADRREGGLKRQPTAAANLSLSLSLVWFEPRAVEFETLDSRGENVMHYRNALPRADRSDYGAIHERRQLCSSGTCAEIKFARESPCCCCKTQLQRERERETPRQVLLNRVSLASGSGDPLRERTCRSVQSISIAYVSNPACFQVFRLVIGTGAARERGGDRTARRCSSPSCAQENTREWAPFFFLKISPTSVRDGFGGAQEDFF